MSSFSSSLLLRSVMSRIMPVKYLSPAMIKVLRTISIGKIVPSFLSPSISRTLFMEVLTPVLRK